MSKHCEKSTLLTGRWFMSLWKKRKPSCATTRLASINAIQQRIHHRVIECGSTSVPIHQRLDKLIAHLSESLISDHPHLCSLRNKLPSFELLSLDHHIVVLKIPPQSPRASISNRSNLTTSRGRRTQREHHNTSCIRQSNTWLVSSGSASSLSLMPNTDRSCNMSA
jgi:hypothetical protein